LLTRGLDCLKLISFVQQLKKRRKLILFLAIAIISILIEADHSACANETDSSTSSSQQTEAEPVIIPTEEARQEPVDTNPAEGTPKEEPVDTNPAEGSTKEEPVETNPAEGTPKEDPVITNPTEEPEIVIAPAELPQLEITVSPYGMTVDEYKSGFKTENIVIKTENVVVDDQALIETGMHVFLDGIEHTLIVNIATSEIVRGTTVGEQTEILTENDVETIIVKDSNLNIIENDSVVLQAGFIIEADLEVTLVKIVPPIHMIVLNENQDSITVGEWKELDPTNRTDVNDGFGNDTTDDVVIENGFIATIAGEEFRLVIDKNTSKLGETNGGGNLETPPEEVKNQPNPQPVQEYSISNDREQEEAIARAEKEAKEKAEREAKIKADAEASVKAIIKAKADAKIKAEQQAAFMKEVEASRIKMDRTLKNWQEAKKELSFVNKTTNSIKLIGGTPNTKQVAHALGQYQAIVDQFFIAGKYNDVIITVSDAVEVFTKKKVDKDVIVDFVKKNIKTSRDVQIIINDLKKKKLRVIELEKYKNTLRNKEAAFDAALKRKLR
jgi:hypothetical protein